MQTKIVLFNRNDVEKVWPLAVEMIQLACDTNGGFDAKDVLAACKKGTFQLWLIVGDNDKVYASVVTEVRNYPKIKVCDIKITTGVMYKRWFHHIDDIAAWAKRQGCKKMEVFARPGWERVLKHKGYVKTHVQIEKEL